MYFYCKNGGAQIISHFVCFRGKFYAFILKVMSNQQVFQCVLVTLYVMV